VSNELTKKDQYYFCDKCNPEHNEKSNKGCYYCCSGCQTLIVIDSDDDDYCCENCGDRLCQNCFIWDEDDDNTYCKDCSNKPDEDEEGITYECLDCNNQNLTWDFYNCYFCLNCNPKMCRKEKKGYFKRCKVCNNFISMNNKKDFECQSCEGIVCNNCYVKDEEGYTICKGCKEDD
jgi:hypothetical protein